MLDDVPHGGIETPGCIEANDDCTLVRSERFIYVFDDVCCYWRADCIFHLDNEYIRCMQHCREKDRSGTNNDDTFPCYGLGIFKYSITFFISSHTSLFFDGFCRR